MTDRGRMRLLWIAATLAVAALVHLGSIYLLPHIVMSRALARMGEANMMHVGKRPDATARAIVRPSPDLLYSVCPFDLSKGALRFVARVPHTTYWSVSAFDSDTNNFFVRNDRQIVGNSYEILLLRRGMPWPRMDDATERAIVFAPSDRGLILIRVLVDDEKNLAAVDAIRRHAGCETVAPARGIR
jgi:uncharacterized membrane protein